MNRLHEKVLRRMHNLIRGTLQTTLKWRKKTFRSSGWRSTTSRLKRISQEFELLPKNPSQEYYEQLLARVSFFSMAVGEQDSILKYYFYTRYVGLEERRGGALRDGDGFRREDLQLDHQGCERRILSTDSRLSDRPSEAKCSHTLSTQRQIKVDVVDFRIANYGC